MAKRLGKEPRLHALGALPLLRRGKRMRQAALNVQEYSEKQNAIPVHVVVDKETIAR